MVAVAITSLFWVQRNYASSIVLSGIVINGQCSVLARVPKAPSQVSPVAGMRSRCDSVHNGSFGTYNREGLAASFGFEALDNTEEPPFMVNT